MNEKTRLLLEKADEAIQAAKVLLDNQHAEFATGRAYYAMFYTAEALLNEKGLHFSKHGGVHGAFGEHYIKTGLFDVRYHRWLLNLFDQRIMGDYYVGVSFTNADVEEMIQQAEEFLQTAKEYLGS